MTDNSYKKPLKQSRKSKLIPRSDDENTVLQTLRVHTKQTSPSTRSEPHWPRIAPKIMTIGPTGASSANVMNSQSPAVMDTANNPVDYETLIDNSKMKDSSREFNVTVAVEEFSDDTDSQNVQNEDFCDFLPALNRDDILDEANSILNDTDSTNNADKLLSIEVKNSLGFYQKYIPSPFEIQIQAVLEQWNAWYKLVNVKYRSSPLFYKCYMCKMSWWYFYDFREHLKEHDNFILSLEKETCIVNIVANRKAISVKSKSFYTEGDCPKCGNDFEIHKGNCFRCKAIRCSKTFSTCFALREHENTSHTVLELTGTPSSSEQWKKACEVCQIVYTWNDYNKHMALMHSVRSDALVSFEYKKCSHCQMKYICDWLHICSENFNMQQLCQYCYRILPKECKHFDKNLGCICKICTIVLDKQCMQAEHLMTHTDKFIMVKKCVICEDFNVFIDDIAAQKHRSNVHSQLDHKITNCFYSIIIPKSCINGERANRMAPVARITFKEEPADTWPKPQAEIKIKQEIVDDYISNTGHNIQEEMHIKEEIVYDEESNEPENYAIHITNNYDDSERILGIKLETIVKEEQESDYEDDIIKLDFNYPDLVQDCQQGSSQDCLQDSIKFLQDSIEENKVLKKKRKYVRKKIPKLYTCGKCGFQASHREFRNHVHLHGSNFLDLGNTFKCTKCYNTYDSLKSYINHLTDHNLKLLSCPECFKVFNTDNLLWSHVATHIRTMFRMFKLYTLSNKSPLFKCQNCLENVNKANFFDHWEQHLTLVDVRQIKQLEPENGNSAESLVNKAFDYDIMQELLKRLQSPDVKSTIRQGCIICHRHFSRKNDCKRHLIEHLLTDALSRVTETDGIKCQICAKAFQKPDKYKCHMRDHGYLPIYKCVLCDKTFSDSSNFTKHKKIHNVNAYTCDTCGRKFQAKASIETHVKLHETQAPIVCSVCHKVFYFEANFKKHYRVHARTPLRFRCMVCSQFFNCLKDKWDHLWKVHKLRSQKADCPICEKSYRKFNDLKQHVKMEHKSKVTKQLLKSSGFNRNKLKYSSTTKNSAEETLIVY